MNVQYAIKDNEIYVIEVNPRASRTVPFVGKATGVPWAKIAAKVMAGKSLAELGVKELPDPKHTSVKEVGLPVQQVPRRGRDPRPGDAQHRRSDGHRPRFSRSPSPRARSRPGRCCRRRARCFISVRDGDKEAIVPVARSCWPIAASNHRATGGTHAVLRRRHPRPRAISKLAEGRPNIKDYIKNGEGPAHHQHADEEGPADGRREDPLDGGAEQGADRDDDHASAAAQAIAAMQKGTGA